MQSDQSFPRTFSLKKKNLFIKCWKEGKKLKGKYITVYVLENKENFLFRVGVVISKKVVKKAVERNLWRRRVKEILRREFDKDKLAGYDFVINFNKRCIPPGFWELREDLVSLRERIYGSKKTRYSNS